MTRFLWRAMPPAHLAETVRKLALSEGRTDSNMLVRLVTEALNARRAADVRVNQMATAIRELAEVNN
jgi:CopG-like RHH_1 or ribbon-helix-helix domain, RHH_5